MCVCVRERESLQKPNTPRKHPRGFLSRSSGPVDEGRREERRESSGTGGTSGCKVFRKRVVMAAGETNTER